MELRRLFTVLRQHRRTSVQDRAAYGQVAKDVIRHTATREVALMAVAQSMSDHAAVEDVTAQIKGRMERRRRQIDRWRKCRAACRASI
jgi:hypothetical protein